LSVAKDLMRVPGIINWSFSILFAFILFLDIASLASRASYVLHLRLY